jgi:hypothetical protein
MLNPFFGLWVIITAGIGVLIIFQIKMNRPDVHIWADISHRNPDSQILHYAGANQVIKEVKTYAEPYREMINEIPEAMADKIQVRYSGSSEWLDKDINLGASNALKRNVSVPHGCVKIRVQDGVVTLSGEIGWEYQKFAAGEAVRYLKGVVSINNQITIKPKVNSRW